MTTQKRRVIYMTDQEWAALKAHAAKRGESISEVIRQAWNGPPSTVVTVSGVVSKDSPEDQRVTSQAQRDAILRRINRKTGDAQ